MGLSWGVSAGAVRGTPGGLLRVLRIVLLVSTPSHVQLCRPHWAPSDSCANHLTRFPINTEKLPDKLEGQGRIMLWAENPARMGALLSEGGGGQKVLTALQRSHNIRESR